MRKVNSDEFRTRASSRDGVTKSQASRDSVDIINTHTYHLDPVTNSPEL
jgi:hypothetical protein